jgi:CBS domain-containing protein
MDTQINNTQINNTLAKNVLAKDMMWSAPPIISPNTTLQQAAQVMMDTNAGVLPVGTDGKVQGIITDRDIVIRAISLGKDPANEKIVDFMTTEIYSCKEEDSICDAAALMKKKKITRIAVMDDDDKFAGILSFGHIFRTDANAEESAEAITRAAVHHQKNH